jgi:hypothetical protein
LHVASSIGVEACTDDSCCSANPGIGETSISNYSAAWPRFEMMHLEMMHLEMMH